MKRTPLLIAALMPLVATAGASTGTQLDHAELQNDLQVTKLLGANVQSSTGEEIGAVEDVLLDSDGNVKSVIVQREGDIEGMADSARDTAEETMASAERNWEDVTSEEEDAATDVDDSAVSDTGAADAADERDGMGLDPDRAGTAEIGDEFATVDWSSVSWDEESGVVQLSGDSASLQAVQYDQTAASPPDEIRASELVGMEVNLADEESFGEVEDVLIDMEQGRASAIVVDSMEFFDKERYALPVDLNAINTEDEELTLQYTQQQIEDMEEFDMDETTERT
jgi:sporulation protein YlmC with PRC-barrel domain